MTAFRASCTKSMETPQSQRMLDELFDGVPEADERKMLSENAAQVFRFN